MPRPIALPFLLALACTVQAPPIAGPELPVAQVATRTGPAPEPGALIDVYDNLYGRYVHAQKAPAIGQQAPRFALPTSEGGTFDLDQALARGQPVVLVFYRAHW